MEKKKKKEKVVVHPRAIRLLVETTWKFAHALIWQQFSLTKEEIEVAKLYIKDYYERIPAKRFQQLAIQYFKNYRAYIRLAAKYISSLPQPHLAAPALWLNRKQVKRFCNSKAKHYCMLQKRSNKCLLVQYCKDCNCPDSHFTA